MDILAYADKGGVIVYLLIAISFFGFSIMIFKFFTILGIKSKKELLVGSFLKTIKKR